MMHMDIQGKIRKLRLFSSLFSLFLISLYVFSNCATEPENIRELKITNTDIYTLLDTFLLEELEYINKDLEVLIITFKKDSNECQFRLTHISRNSLNTLFYEHRKLFLGYFQYKSFPVFVFGPPKNDFFRLGNRNQNFEYLKKKEELESSEIPPPPSLFEPIVYFYRYKDATISFEKAGRFYLFE